MLCFLFITPLAAISGWLCLRGAQDHLQLGSWLQALGLITLTIALFTIYVLWTLVNVTPYGSPLRAVEHQPNAPPPRSCAGVLPLPLPAVFRVEKNEPESASARSRNEGVQLFPALAAVHRPDEEAGQREYSMRTSGGAGAGAGCQGVRGAPRGL